MAIARQCVLDELDGAIKSASEEDTLRARIQGAVGNCLIHMLSLDSEPDRLWAANLSRRQARELWGRIRSGGA